MNRRDRERIHRRDNAKNMGMYILSRWSMFCVVSAMLPRYGLSWFRDSLERMTVSFTDFEDCETLQSAKVRDSDR